MLYGSVRSVAWKMLVDVLALVSQALLVNGVVLHTSLRTVQLLCLELLAIGTRLDLG